MTNEPPRIVVMANQIATFFESGDGAVEQTVDHIALFWDPRMRAQLQSHLTAGGEGLTPVARAAAERLAPAHVTPG